MRPILKVEDLAKQYRLGTRDAHYDTLRESLMRTLRAPLGRFQQSTAEFVWALQDVSFQATAGDVIGIIGKNGAGKSTLLKILSRITEPTSGRAELYGRVGSLLEVGTGFHQELSGRENIFLNGAILGMRRNEIVRKFDEIVAFAEVERFIDTPVKRYSSGMYLRLAFAVAAFLETEILLVDEVLAVGDASFQKKCLGKMRDVSSAGRTVMLVSHNMAAMEALCNRCLFIAGGRLLDDGRPHEIVSRYLAAETSPELASRSLKQHSGRAARKQPLMQRVSLLSDSGHPSSTMRMGEGLRINVAFDSGSLRIRPFLAVTIKNNYGMPVVTVSNRHITQYSFRHAVESGTIECRLDKLPLLEGIYSIDLFFGEEYQNLDVILDAISFEVLPADVFGSGQMPNSQEGSIYWPATFALSNSEAAIEHSR